MRLCGCIAPASHGSLRLRCAHRGGGARERWRLVFGRASTSAPLRMSACERQSSTSEPPNAEPKPAAFTPAVAALAEVPMKWMPISFSRRSVLRVARAELCGRSRSGDPRGKRRGRARNSRTLPRAGASDSGAKGVGHGPRCAALEIEATESLTGGAAHLRAGNFQPDEAACGAVGGDRIACFEQ